MSRKRIWIEDRNFQGFGCSECDWRFKPSGTVVGESLDEMKRKFAAHLDKEFTTHICVKTPKSPGTVRGQPSDRFQDDCSQENRRVVLSLVILLL